MNAEERKQARDRRRKETNKLGYKSLNAYAEIIDLDNYLRSRRHAYVQALEDRAEDPNTPPNTQIAALKTLLDLADRAHPPHPPKRPNTLTIDVNPTPTQLEDLRHLPIEELERLAGIKPQQ